MEEGGRFGQEEHFQTFIFPYLGGREGGLTKFDIFQKSALSFFWTLKGLPNYISQYYPLTHMNAAGVFLEALRLSGVEWLAWGGGDEPLGPLAEELEDGVDPDGEHKGYDDDLVHVGNVHWQKVTLISNISHS